MFILKFCDKNILCVQEFMVFLCNIHVLVSACLWVLLGSVIKNGGKDA